MARGPAAGVPDCGGRMTEAEIAIVGAGPAGLSAALYAARFLRATLVLHDRAPRAAQIPLTRNVPGFVDGIAGPDLLQRMTHHAMKYGARLIAARVERATRTKDGTFELQCENGRSWSARALILATGVEHNRLPIDADLHERAIKQGAVRYCPVCDGYEHVHDRIGVVGCDVSGAAEALFLRQFSPNVRLLTQRAAELTERQRRELAHAGIRTITEPIESYELVPDGMEVKLTGDDLPLAFDVLYAALGVRPRNALARMLGLAIVEGGNVAPDAPLGTACPGVFCAGDIVEGLDQISVAMGQGAVAATRAHNWLRDRDGETVVEVLDADAR